MSGFRTIVPQVQAALTAAIAAGVPSDTAVSLGYPPGGLCRQADLGRGRLRPRRRLGDDRLEAA